MHKRAVICDMCGKGFFPASLKIHQPQCLKKQQMMHIPCSFCQIEVRRIEMENHLKTCPSARKHRKRNKDSRKKKTQNNAGASKFADQVYKQTDEAFVRPPGVQSGVNSHISSREADLKKSTHPPKISQEHGGNNTHIAFGRVECRHCGRKFDAGRIGKHQNICANLKHGPAKSLKAHSRPGLGVNARINSKDSSQSKKNSQRATGFTNSRKKSHSLPRRQTTARDTTYQNQTVSRSQNSSFSMKDSSKAPRNKTSWREQRKQLKAAMKAGRQMTRFEKGLTNVMPDIKASPPNPSLVPCPHCGRSFSESAAERHIPICKNLVSTEKIYTRPKPVRASARHYNHRDTASNFVGKTNLDNANKWGGVQTRRAQRGGHGGIAKGNHTSSDNPLWGKRG